MSFGNDTNRAEILESCILEFWNKRKIDAFKTKEDYHFMLGDHKNEILSDVIATADGEEVPLTPISYIKIHKLTRPRIFFLTKLKSVARRVADIIEVNNSDSDFEDPKFPYSSMIPENNFFIDDTLDDTANNTENTSGSIVDNSIQNPTVLENMQDSSTPLLGSTAERAQLRNVINENFSASLMADERKSETEQEKERLDNLMRIRKGRVQSEPESGVDRVICTVRHVSDGNKTRYFLPKAKMVQLYDWAGSFTPVPEHYEILDYRGSVVSPESNIAAGVYNMRSTNEPLNMSNTGTVAFLGFSVSGNIPQQDFQDSITPQDDLTKTTIFQLRQEEIEKFIKETSVFIVSRDDVYSDLISYYNCFSFTRELQISFTNETGVGDGVTRDALSTFLHNALLKFDGCNERVPSPLLDDKELETIGQIITHAYVLFELFPIELSKTALKYFLFEDVDESELFNSFLNYLPEREEEIIRSFSRSSNNNVQGIVDIQSEYREYRVYSIPTPDNVTSLCVKAARMSLIKIPANAMKCLLRGMGEVWIGTNKNQFDFIYNSGIPTAEAVIENLDVMELNNHDQKITTWLHRFIRSCTLPDLKLLLRFVTGSATFISGSTIKVEYVNQHLRNLFPTAATCFKILRLPRQYSSFHQLRNNLSEHINNKELWAVHDAD